MMGESWEWIMARNEREGGREGGREREGGSKGERRGGGREREERVC